jgi:signal transduction histidine kinase
MDGEQRDRFLDNADADLQRMERLVSGLLALARAEETSGHVPLRLDDVVDAVVRRHPGVARTGAGGRVVGTPAQLEAVVENLVDNALRHGGEGVSVSVQTWTNGELTGVDVLDDGPGISIGNRGRIFERFFTTDRQRGGTGLGLSLAQAVCRAHGGGIDVRSEPGQTRFQVALPVGDED